MTNITESLVATGVLAARCSQEGISLRRLMYPGRTLAEKQTLVRCNNGSEVSVIESTQN